MFELPYGYQEQKYSIYMTAFGGNYIILKRNDASIMLKTSQSIITTFLP